MQQPSATTRINRPGSTSPAYITAIIRSRRKYMGARAKAPGNPTKILCSTVNWSDRSDTTGTMRSISIDARDGMTGRKNS